MDKKKFALIISVSAYQDPGLPGLTATTGDAQELAEVFGSQEIGGFDVRHLTDPTSAQMREALEDFFLDRTPEDFLLLYFAGHGVSHNDGELFLATVDTKLLPNGDPKKSTAVSAAFVNEIVGDSNCGRKLLLLDCCYSGRFAHAMMKSRGAPDVNLADHFRDARGVIVLASSNARQQSFEDASGGVFTRTLLQGIRNGEADRDQDGWFSHSDVYDYVCEQLRNHRSPQKPTQAGRLEGQLMLARNPHVKAAPLPTEVNHALESPLPRIRLAAVEELWQLAVNGSPGLRRAAREEMRRIADPEQEDSRQVWTRAREYLAKLGEGGAQESSAGGSAAAAPAPARVRPEPTETSEPEAKNSTPAAAKRGRPKAAGQRAGGVTAEREREKAELERLTQAKIARGRALQEKGDLKEAISEYRAAMKLGNGSAEVRYYLGTALYAGKDLDGAIAEGEAAIGLKPGYTEAYALLCRAFGDKGRAERQIKFYQKAIKYFRNSGLAPNHLRRLEQAINTIRVENQAARKRAEQERLEARRAEQKRAQREAARERAEQRRIEADRAEKKQIKAKDESYKRVDLEAGSMRKTYGPGGAKERPAAGGNDALGPWLLEKQWTSFPAWMNDISFHNLINNSEALDWMIQRLVASGKPNKDIIAQLEQFQKVKTFPEVEPGSIDWSLKYLTETPASRGLITPFNFKMFNAPSGKVLAAALTSLIQRDHMLTRVVQGMKTCALSVDFKPSLIASFQFDASPLAGLEPAKSAALVTIEEPLFAGGSVTVRVESPESASRTGLFEGLTEADGFRKNLFRDIGEAASDSGVQR